MRFAPSIITVFACLFSLFAPNSSARASEQSVSSSSHSLRLTLRLRDSQVITAPTGGAPSIWFELELKNESTGRQEIIENAFVLAGRPEAWGTPELEMVDSEGKTVRMTLPEPCPPTEVRTDRKDEERRMAPRLRELETSLRKRGASQEDIKMMLDLERKALRENWVRIRRSWLRPGAARRSLPYSEPRIMGCDEIPMPPPKRFSELKVGGISKPGHYKLRATYSDAVRWGSDFRIVTPWIPVVAR